MDIIPAVLTHSKNEFHNIMNGIHGISSHIQIDFMDGIFTPKASIHPREMYYYDFGDVTFEAHIMANKDNTEKLIQSLKSFQACTRIIIHQEITTVLEELRQLTNQIKDIGKEVGIAINPDTDIRDIGKMVKKINYVQFMGVTPGFYGSRLQPQVIDKVLEFVERYTLYEGKIGWDGGVNITTLPLIKELPLDQVAVGSAIVKANTPHKSFKELQAICNK